MNPSNVAVAATTMLLASTSLSLATTIQEVQTYGPATTNWGTSTSNSSFTPTMSLNFSGFNTGLGTLHSVTVTVTEEVSGSVNLTNNGETSSNVSGNILNTLKYTLPSAVSTFVLSDSSSIYSATLGAHVSSGYQAVSGSATYHFTPSSAYSYFTSNASKLAFYETSWSALVGDLGAVVTSSDNGNGSAVFTDLGKVTFTVTYDYTPSEPPPVPEPATLAVLGSALAGLSLVRRRRR